jgi:hypothetical protein
VRRRDLPQTSPASPLHPNWAKEWKKSKRKTKDLRVLVNSGFLRKKEMELRCVATGDPYLMEKNPYEIPMFARFAECGVAVSISDFFKGLLRYYDIKYLNLNPLASSTFLFSCISLKHLWESSPTGFCSGSFSE